MTIALFVVSLIIAIFLAFVGTVFLILGSLSKAVTGYGKSVRESGKVFLWSGLGMLVFLTLVFTLDTLQI